MTLTTIERKSARSLKSVASMDNGHAGVKIERIVVTPEIAAAWLDKNTLNRNRAANHVARLSRDMASGKWQFTGDAIRFSDDGDLIDGQHRLAACIKAETPFETLVIYNIPSASQAAIDSVKPRRAADMLSMRGHNYANGLAAAARLLLSEANGQFVQASNWTTSEVLAALEKHPRLATSVRIVYTEAMPRGVNKTAASFLHYAVTMMGEDERAESFVRVLHSGVPDYDGDPVHNLRERIIRSHDGSQRIHRTELYRGMKYALNLFRNRVPVKLLKWPKDVAIVGLDLSLL